LQDTVNIRISTLKTDTKQKKDKNIYMKLFELVTLQGQVQHNKY